MTEIEIYFDNGNKARYPIDSVIFDVKTGIANNMSELRDEMVLVNWNNVCFVRKREAKEADDE